MPSNAISKLLPRPLLLLLAAVALLGVTWALIVPPWQSPDEPAHFSYAQGLGEGLELPGDEPGQIFSTEQELAADRSNSLQTAGSLFSQPEWSAAERERWELADERLAAGARSDAGAGNPARSNPPLYYAYEAVPYVAASGGDIFSRLYVMRVASMLFLLVAVVATWHLVGELLGRRSVLQLVGASIVGIQPMAVFISASVNPDGLLIAMFATTMLLGVRVLRHGMTLPRGVALCAVVAAGVLTKGTAYALVPPLALVLIAGAVRLRAGWARRATAIAVPALAFLLPVGAWLAVARLGDRPAVNQVASGGGDFPVELPGPADYLWQYYLPKLPFQVTLPESYPSLPAFEYWVQGGWASFGWLEVQFPTALYWVIAAITVVVVVGGAVALVRARSRSVLLVAAFLGLIAACLLAGLHAVDFRTLTSQGGPFSQGRYILPLLPLLGVAAAGALSLAGGRLRVGLAGGLLGALFALQIFSLALVASRYYA